MRASLLLALALAGCAAPPVETPPGAPPVWSPPLRTIARQRPPRVAPLTVRAVDPSGAPVAGAWIEVFESLWAHEESWFHIEDDELVARPRPDVQGRTGADGAVTFAEAPGWFWLVVARAEGRACSARVVLPADEGAADVTLCLPRGQRLTGVVRDHDLAPVPNARVLAGVPPYTAARDAGATHVVATTDANGRYVLAGLPPCDLDLWVARDGEEGRRAMTANAGWLDELDLPGRPTSELRGNTLDAKHTGVYLPRAPELVRGRVVDARGHPLAGAYVLRRADPSVRAGSAGKAPGPGMWTLLDGSFEVPAAPAVEVHYPGLAPRIAALADGTTVALGPERPLRVFVTDDTGAAVPGAHVGLGPPPTSHPGVPAYEVRRPPLDAFTGADGTAHVPLVDGLEQDVHVLGRDTYPGRATVPADDSPVFIVVERAAALSGTLRFDDGAPVAGALLVIEHVDHEDGAPIFVRNPHVSRADGSFSYRGLDPGRYRLQVAHDTDAPEPIPFVLGPVWDAPRGTTEVELRIRGRAP